MNSPAALIGTTVENASQVINSWGFIITPETLTMIAKDVGEHSILSRAGGAPTFAVGMAHIITEVFNSRAMMAFWYHFAILFEALFILTAVDAGTRACRFMVQESGWRGSPRLANNRSWFGNLAGTTVAVAGWGSSFIRAWSIRWRHQHPVAAVWYRQPDAGLNGVDPRYRCAV